MKRVWIIAAILLAGLSAVAQGGGDPFVGTWTMNVAKSQYPAGALPKSMVIEMEAADAGVRYKSKTVHANGTVSVASYTATYNGKEALVLGGGGLLLPVSLKRVAPGTVIAGYKRGMLVVATSRREVSPDGRTMTITTVSTDKDGNSVTSVGIYDRK